MPMLAGEVPREMATRTAAGRRAPIGARTLRRDRWWAQPATSFVVLVGFVIYSTWAAFQNANYFADPYISPLYSPCIAKICAASGAPHLSVVGSWWTISPAILILIVPLGFRLTCYYYRRTYYRAFWLSPPACAVAEPRARYTGETRFPLILQNAHRYFLYLALAFNLILTYDAIVAFDFPDRADRERRPAVALQPLVPLVPASVRRERGRLLEASGALPPVAAPEPAQRAASPVRLGVARLGGLHRRLRAPGGVGHDPRPEDLLTVATGPDR
jgi:hypothetical protein